MHLANPIPQVEGERVSQWPIVQYQCFAKQAGRCKYAQCALLVRLLIHLFELQLDGHGLGFLGAMVLVNKIAPDERRAEVTSAFYVISYLGVALPAVAVGFSAQLVGLFAAVVGFSGLVGLLALALLALSRRVVAAS